MNNQIKLTVKEYSDRYNITKQAVYNKIKRGTLDVEVVNGVKYIVENNIKPLNQPLNNGVELNESIEIYRVKVENKENEIKRLNNQILELKEDKLKLEKEKEELKYQVKEKDINIKQLLNKMESLNDRVIGLIEWKSKSWWQKILKK